MKLFIKNMVSDRCKIVVKSELEKLGFHSTIIALGEVEIEECLTPEDQTHLNANLKKSGLALLEDKKSILVEKNKKQYY